MKAKSKGLGGFKGLLLAHGEKLVIAVVAVCVGMLIWKSLGLERLPDSKQASELQKQISQVNTEVTAFDWNKAVEEHPGEVRKMKPATEKGAGEIPKDAYVNPTWSTGWDSPVVPPTVMRIDPVMLEVQDIEVSSGSGLFAFTNDAIRKKREQERQLAQEQQAAAAQKQQAKEAKDQAEGGRPGRNTGRETATANVPYPLHPKWRAVVNAPRPMGVPLADDEEVKTAYWAVITGKVPIKEQIKLYHDAFQNARGYDPNTDDMPMYLGYFVERAEVRNNQELEWTRVAVSNGKGEVLSRFVNSDILYGVQGDDASKPAKRGVVTDWAAQVPEIVDPRYLDPSGVLAFPLPPLVGHDWLRNVTQSEIPLATDAPTSTEDVKPVEQAKPAAGDEDVFRAGSAERSNMGVGARPGPTGGMGAYGSMGRGAMPMGEGRGMSYQGGEYGGMGRGQGGMYAGGAMGTSAPPEVASWLFRFFDFTVEPGKKYKYRIKLVVQDPNQAPSVRLESLAPDVVKRVKDEKSKRNSSVLIPYRITEWSKPSRLVSIPQAGSVKVASAKIPSAASMAEPEATLLVESFGDEQGKAVQAALEEKFKRGAVANMTKSAEHQVDGGRAIEPLDNFSFRTGIMVADISGGDKISRDMLRPAQVLLMDGAGQLFVQNETDDAEAVAIHNEAFAKSDPRNPNAGYPGGRGEMQGRGER